MQPDATKEQQIAELEFSARKGSKEARKALFKEYESSQSYDTAGKLAYETGDLKLAMKYFEKGGYFSEAQTIAAHLGDKEAVDRLGKSIIHAVQSHTSWGTLTKEVHYLDPPGVKRVNIAYKIDLPPREEFEASLTFPHGPRKNGPSPRKEKARIELPVYKVVSMEDGHCIANGYYHTDESITVKDAPPEAVSGGAVIAKRTIGKYVFKIVPDVSAAEVAMEPQKYVIIIPQKCDGKELRMIFNANEQFAPETEVDVDVARHVGDSEGSTAVKNYWKMAQLGSRVIGIEALPEDAWKTVADSMLYIDADGDEQCVKVEERACWEPREEEKEDENEDEPGHRTEFPARWVNEKLQFYVKMGDTAIRAVQMAAERLYAADFDMEEFKQALRNDPEHPELRNLSFTHSAHEMVRLAATLAFEDFCFDNKNCFRGFEKITQFLEMAIPNEVANYDFETGKPAGTYGRRTDEGHNNIISDVQSSFMEMHPHTAEICDECNFERWTRKEEARKQGPKKVERPWGRKGAPDELYEAFEYLKRTHFSNPGCELERKEKTKQAAKLIEELKEQKKIPGGFVDPVVETGKKLEWMEKQRELSKAKGSA